MLTSFAKSVTSSLACIQCDSISNGMNACGSSVNVSAVGFCSGNVCTKGLATDRGERLDKYRGVSQNNTNKFHLAGMNLCHKTHNEIQYLSTEQ